MCIRDRSKYFRYATHYFICIISHTNDGIGSSVRSTLQHQLKCILSCSFTEFLVNGNISSKDRLKTTCYITNYTARTNSDAPNDTQVFYDPVTAQFNIGCNHSWVYHIDYFHKCTLIVSQSTITFALRRSTSDKLKMNVAGSIYKLSLIHISEP